MKMHPKWEMAPEQGPPDLDACEVLAKAMIDEFHAELDLDTMNKLADGRLIWDGTHLRNSRGEIL